MIFNIPLAVWLGGLTFISLVTTVSLGIAMFYFQKPVFKYHRIFAFLTISLAVIHGIIAFLLWFFGITL
ncbi:hypothetical protein A3K82_01235 [Candidatus Pacearchaeota archaeon RBG_19FT_COMBO_34_9]|nr:MAG: hypothetical protein A3K82_01235 [Candidatus Pacearchaeota archaeon RBG_19FT_COMBO_34_9]OGJ16338.1 MAG: hypothetical protein A3K74_01965 [Candidatus Pacearchaeota archaeon RBG_13_33_26]